MSGADASSSIQPELVRSIKRSEYDRMVELGLFQEERIELIRGVLVKRSPQSAPHPRWAGAGPSRSSSCSERAMADVLAIVSKAVFEKAAGKSPALGDSLAMDRYVSANKNLAPVAAAGKLYLVTVRPPDERLWLVAILDGPAFDGTQWVSAPSTIPITDITHLQSALRFESGAGITAKPGALGMSLQAPRVLTAEDAARLDAAAGGAAGAAGEGACRTTGSMTRSVR